MAHEIAVTASSLIVTSASQEFSQGAAVAIGTALEHSPKGTRGVLLTSGFSRETEDGLRKLGRSLGSEIEVIETGRWTRNLPVKGRYAEDTWSRLFMGEFPLREDARVVYLDADTLTRRAIGDLFRLDLRGEALAALPDPVITRHQIRGPGWMAWSGSAPDATYFNTGVLVIDVREWRRRRITERALEVMSRGTNELDYVDQDVLNVVVEGEWKALDPVWHDIVDGDAGSSDAAIIHFSGPVKPWDVKDPRGPLDVEYSSALGRMLLH